jgi:hypothetical protein
MTEGMLVPHCNACATRIKTKVEGHNYVWSFYLSTTGPVKGSVVPWCWMFRRGIECSPSIHHACRPGKAYSTLIGVIFRRSRNHFYWTREAFYLGYRQNFDMARTNAAVISLEDVIIMTSEKRNYQSKYNFFKNDVILICAAQYPA